MEIIDGQRTAKRITRSTGTGKRLCDTPGFAMDGVKVTMHARGMTVEACSFHREVAQGMQRPAAKC